LHRLSSLARFIILYAALYCAFGVDFPIPAGLLPGSWPDVATIAFVVGLGTAIRLASGPFIGRFADRKRTWRGTVSACAAGGTVAIGSSVALLTFASGSLYAWLGGQAFWAMAILCAAAIPLAGRMTG
jgi:hypothetical protein